MSSSANLMSSCYDGQSCEGASGNIIGSAKVFAVGSILSIVHCFLLARVLYLASMYKYGEGRVITIQLPLGGAY